MSVDLGWLAAEARAVDKASRRISRAAAQLRDAQSRQVAQLKLDTTTGFRDSDVLAFVRVALSRGQEVVITASQPTRAQTTEEPDAQAVRHSPAR